MINTYGCASPADSFQKYSSVDPELNIALEYLSGWVYSEQKGTTGSFAQVVFYRPQKNLSRIAMVVTVSPVAKMTLTDKSLLAVVDSLISKRMKFADAKVLKKSTLNIKNLNVDATEILLSYKTLNSFYSVKSKLIILKERVVIFEYQNKFYTLRYEAKDSEFGRFDQAFSHLIDSLSIK